MAGRRWAGATERGRFAPGTPPGQPSGRQNRPDRRTRQDATVQATLEGSRSHSCPAALPSLMVRCRLAPWLASSAPVSGGRRRRSACDLGELRKKLPDDVHLLLVRGQVLLSEGILGRGVV